MSQQSSTPVITGLGIVAAIGQGKANFTEAMLAGRTKFDYLKREGREGSPPFVGAEIEALATDSLQADHGRLLRRSSLSAQLALLAALEAWQDAQLDSSDADAQQIDPRRIGLVVGGSNIQQRDQLQIWQRHAANPRFVSPAYGLALWDTDLVGILSQALQIQGEGYSVGSASASGAMAIIQAARQIQSGSVDISLAIGSLFDVSSLECHGFRNMGALGSERFQDAPQAACRPFDRDSDGFIYGEGCGVLVLESPAHARRRNAQAHGRLLGWGSALDGNRQPNPNQAGEEGVMLAALQMAGLSASQINYVNTHGTSSPLGDRTEAAAIKAVGLAHAPLNATKSLTGHCLTAAGAVEAIATLLQMQAGRLHPTQNLHNPIDPDLNWVGQAGATAEVEYALSNSFGFGGMNTSLVFGQDIE